MTKTAELDRLLDLATMLQALESRFTELVSVFRGLALNEVLVTELVTLDAAGQFSQDWQVPFASVAALNLDAAPVTINAGTAQQSAPGGIGSHVVPARGFIVVNLTGNVLTLYGAPGAQVNLSVFAKPQAPVAAGLDVTTGSGTSVASDDIVVDGTAGGILLLAANGARKSAVIQNVGGANMRVTYDGSAPTATHGLQVAPGQSVVLRLPAIPTAAVRAIREGGVSTAASVEQTT